MCWTAAAACDDFLQSRGVIVRHLVLPGQEQDSCAVLTKLFAAFGNRVYYSIMNQYTPMPGATGDMARRVTAEEYDRVVDSAWELGVRNGFVQEEGAADEQFIPPFDLTGVE